MSVKEEALERLREGDVYSVVEFLDGQDDTVAALKLYNELQRHFYWEEKNLGLSVALGRAGLQHGLLMGRKSADPDLAKERGDEPMGNAHWLLGAHYLAAGDHAAARTHFEAFHTRSVRTGSESGQRLAEGYSLIVDLVESPEDVEARERFSEVKSTLAPLEDGGFFVEQLDSALGVFQKSNSKSD